MSNPHFPTLFLSHGSPMLVIEACPARQFLMELGKELGRPRAILVISAHWEAPSHPNVSHALSPETIHDFRGFPDALFDIKYPAPGAPDLAARTTALLSAAGIAAESNATRGLDHGAWVPLSLLYPDADVPVTQLSLVQGGSPAMHEQIGDALFPLRREGILIIGSGSLTHNLAQYRGRPIDAVAPDWVKEFSGWIGDRLTTGDRDALRQYRNLAPFALHNHPTEEHLLPLFVAMGAAGQPAKATKIHSSNTYGVLAMDAFAFT